MISKDTFHDADYTCSYVRIEIEVLKIQNVERVQERALTVNSEITWQTIHAVLKTSARPSPWMVNVSGTFF